MTRTCFPDETVQIYRVNDVVLIEKHYSSSKANIARPYKSKTFFFYTMFFY